MPVTTLSDLKDQRDALEAKVAWARTRQKCAATEYERDKATEELVVLLREAALAAEEVRQTLVNRRRYNVGAMKFISVALAVAGLVFVLVV